MTPRRVVIVMLEAPLPFGNAAARWFYVLLKGLVARGHRVTALAACSKPVEIDQARQLFPAPEYDLRLYPFPVRRGLTSKAETLLRPYSYMFSADLKRDLEAELARGYDVLHLEHLWCGWVALRHRAKAVMNVQYLLSIDLEHVRPDGCKGWVVRRLMDQAEGRMLRAFTHYRGCSPRLADAIRRANPSARVSVVPLGIDPSLYTFIPDERRPPAPVVSLIGTMSWHPTLSAAVRLLTRLWPEVKRRVPAARLQLVGWGARAALKDYLHLPDVTVEEDVPDTRPYFERTGVLLYAPSRGSGMKIKVQEAFGYGVPVVTTSEGVEGMPATDGVHAGVCEDDAGLIARTVALLTDPAAQNRQRAAARALLEAHCGPTATLDGIEAVYATLPSGGDAGRLAARAGERPEGW